MSRQHQGVRLVRQPNILRDVKGFYRARGVGANELGRAFFGDVLGREAIYGPREGLGAFLRSSTNKGLTSPAPYIVYSCLAMRGILSEALKGHLDLLLMAAVEAEPAHGYALIREIRERTQGTFDLAEGTIYPALQRLEDDRRLRSDWREVEGRKRRVYRLTATGRAELARRRKDWRTFTLAVTRVLSKT